MNYLFFRFSYLNEEGLTTKYVAVTAAAKIGRPGAAKRRGEEGGRGALQQCSVPKQSENWCGSAIS